MFPSPGSLVHRASLSHPIHPLSDPQRSKHPIIPPGRHSVSSSALAARTAQKHLEGTRRSRTGCGRKPGVRRRSCGAPATAPRVQTPETPKGGEATQRREDEQQRGSEKIEFRLCSGKQLEEGGDLLMSIQCYRCIRPKKPFKNTRSI